MKKMALFLAIALSLGLVTPQRAYGMQETVGEERMIEEPGVQDSVQISGSAPVEATAADSVQVSGSAPMEAAATASPVRVSGSAPVEAAAADSVQISGSAPMEAAATASPVQVSGSAPMEAAVADSVQVSEILPEEDGISNPAAELAEGSRTLDGTIHFMPQYGNTFHSFRDDSLGKLYHLQFFMTWQPGQDYGGYISLPDSLPQYSLDTELANSSGTIVFQNTTDLGNGGAYTGTKDDVLSYAIRLSELVPASGSLDEGDYTLRVRLSVKRSNYSGISDIDDLITASETVHLTDDVKNKKYIYRGATVYGLSLTKGS